MKIGIITVYNSYNCGSFLQAYALYRALKAKKHDVYFVKNDFLKNTDKLYFKLLQAIKYILKRDAKKAYFLVKAYFIYKKCRSMLPVTDKMADMDLILYGSDTIWNIADPYFDKEWKRYWGYGVKQKKASYAASVASTNENDIVNRQELGKSLLEFAGIAVRDEYTYSIIRKILPENVDIARTVDPTMLLNCEDYSDIEMTCDEENFILIYLFSDSDKEAIERISDFAKKENKRVIAFGDSFPADKNIPFDPAYMISYYKKADYIITNTFHGNIFSIIFNKQFVSYGANKKKVVALLDEFSLADRCISKADDISETIKKYIDYNKINELIRKKREDSIEYLDNILQ